MKNKTKVNDLRALLNLRNAEHADTQARQRLAEVASYRYPDPEQCRHLAGATRATSALVDSARAGWMKRPPARRDLAAATLATAEDLARVAARMGGDYSGETSNLVEWGDAPDARTTTSGGDQYSRICTYHRTDATHTVTLHPAGCPLLHIHRRGLVQASARDDLPLIAIYPLAKGETHARRAVWVRKTGKRLEHVAGWIAGNNVVCYHSTKSPEDARKGFLRKHAAYIADLRERRRTRKDERRAALVARLCHGVTATLADARAMHYCEPGIRAFQAKHGVGDSATLPELIATGDPSAVRLALSIARQVRRDTRTTHAA